jgi:hypothetical protein
MSYSLLNTGINCDPTDKQLTELFGNRGDMFLTKVPARLASERGYGNMTNKKKPLKPSYDVNACFPTPKTTYGIFNMVKTDFPKGAGGVEPNPMWADGTYDQMKADFQRQAERQIDSENIRNLIPVRDLRYDLAKYSGGTAQQNKLDFAVSEMFNEEKRKVLQDKIGLVKVKYPTATHTQAIDIAIDEMVGMELGTKQYNLLSDAHKEEVRNLGRQKYYNLLMETQGANPTPEDAVRLEAQRAREAVEFSNKGATMVEMPKKEKSEKGKKTDAEIYREGRMREMGGIDYTGGGVPPESRVINEITMPSMTGRNQINMGGGSTQRRYDEVSRRSNTGGLSGRSQYPGYNRASMTQGVGSGLPAPMPLSAGGGGSGGGMRRGGGTSIPPSVANSMFPGVRARGF